MKVTAQQIADECGVSRGTVDRVVNGRDGVAPEVRARVEQAVARVGYRTPKARRQAGIEVPVGVLVPYWEMRHYRSEMQRGARRAARYGAGDGLRVLVEEMRTRTQREYLESIERLLAQGVRGLVLNASDLPEIRDEIDRIAALGVAVVTLDSDVTGSRRVCHVGQDHARGARVAAGLMERLAPTGDLLIVTGNSEFSTHRLRVDGFLSRMEGRRCRVLECLERYELTYDGVLAEARENPRLRGVYMATECVDACVAALSRAGAAGRVHVVCNDLTPWAREYLLDGRVDYVLHQDYAGQTERAVRILYELLCRNKPPARDVETIAATIVSREMIE